MGERDSGPDFADLTSRSAFFLFAKHPESGLVKTRLAPALTLEGAAKFYDHLLQVLLTRLTDQGADTVAAAYLAFDPPARRLEFEARKPPGWELFQPSGADLVARMSNAFDAAFERGYQRVVLLGSDVPALEVRALRDAFVLLETFDVVLGPDRSGGCYLIGARQPGSGVIESARESAANFRQQVLEQGRQRGISVAELEVLDDLDDPGDLERWLASPPRDADDEHLREVARRWLA